jgi:hypothetical protein
LKKLGEMLVYMLYIANNHVRYILNRLFFLENNTSIYCTVILPRATINYSVEALVHVPNKLKHQPAESLVSIIGSRFFFYMVKDSSLKHKRRSKRNGMDRWRAHLSKSTGNRGHACRYSAMQNGLCRLWTKNAMDPCR